MLNINFCPKPQVLIDQKNSIHPGYEQKEVRNEATGSEKPLWVPPQGPSPYLHSVISKKNILYD